MSQDLEVIYSKLLIYITNINYRYGIERKQKKKNHKTFIFYLKNK